MHERREVVVVSHRDFQQMLTILNSVDALVYVADMDTHEILFINEYGKKKGALGEGKKCWEIFQNTEGPCSFCTNNKLLDDKGLPAKTVQWICKNRKNGRWYDCRDTAIQWVDGRYVRLEIATDITEQKMIEEDLCIKGQAMNSSVNAIVIADMKGKITYINRSFLKLWGYTSEVDVIGCSIVEFWKQKNKANVVVDTMMKEGKWAGELVAERADGTTKDVYLSASVVYNEDGIPINLMASFIDITKTKNLQEKLLKNQAMLIKTQEIANVGSWELDTISNQLYWSDEVYNMFGVSKNTPITYEDFLECVHPEDRAVVHHAYTQSLTKDTYEIEHRVITKDTKEVRFVYEKCIHQRDPSQ